MRHATTPRPQAPCAHRARAATACHAHRCMSVAAKRPERHGLPAHARGRACTHNTWQRADRMAASSWCWVGGGLGWLSQPGARRPCRPLHRGAGDPPAKLPQHGHPRTRTARGHCAWPLAARPLAHPHSRGHGTPYMTARAHREERLVHEGIKLVDTTARQQQQQPRRCQRAAILAASHRCCPMTTPCGPCSSAYPGAVRLPAAPRCCLQRATARSEPVHGNARHCGLAGAACGSAHVRQGRRRHKDTERPKAQKQGAVFRCILFVGRFL